MILLTRLIITLHLKVVLRKKVLNIDINISDCTVFLQPTDKEEIANIISSLNFNKASDPYTILFLLKNKISRKFADLFNLSLMAGVFALALKTEKVVHVFKKDSELDSNCPPISLLSNIEKILEKIMYKRL